jgi:hypothetical protein
VITPGKPKTWRDWYRFARERLDYGHVESLEYANHRFVEAENRDRLRVRAPRRRA